MVQLLIYAIDNTWSTSTLRWKRGDVVGIYDDGYYINGLMKDSNWDGRPKDKFIIIHVTGITKAEVEEFLERKYSTTSFDRDGYPDQTSRRKFHIEPSMLPLAARQEIAANRRITITKAQVQAIRKNR